MRDSYQSYWLQVYCNLTKVTIVNQLFYLFAEDRDNWNRGWQKVIAIDFSWWQPIEEREVWTSYIRTIGRLDMACLWNSLTQSNVFRLLSMSFHTYPQVSASVNAHKTQSTLMTANPFLKYVTQITVKASNIMAITVWAISPTSLQPTPINLCHQLSTNWATITLTLVNV